MKQLKVIQKQVSSTNPFFTASFTESITISPNSRIWFDKISLNILSSGPDGQIEIGPQTILVAPNILGDPVLSQGYRTCYLAGGTYPTINDLYTALTAAMNKSLYTNPTTSNEVKMPDVGLAYLVLPSTIDATNTEIAFVQSPCTQQTNPIDTNINKGVYWWTPAVTPLPWSLIFPTPVLAGGLQCNSAVYFPDLTLYGDNNVFIGLYTAVGVGPVYDYVRTFGFTLIDGVWYFYNENTLTDIPDQAAFQNANDPPTTYMSWFVDPNDNASLKVGLFDNSTPVVAQILSSPNGTFQGYNVATNYFFGADGIQGAALLPVQILDPFITYMPNVVQVNSGWKLDTGINLNANYQGLKQLTYGSGLTFPATPLGPRNVKINFSDALVLMGGLGFATIYNFMTGLSGSITSQGPYGFLNFYDLALDVFNFALESYRSTTLSGDIGVSGRVATLGYFVPIPTTNVAGQTTYYAETKQLTFIDIKNKEPQVIESLNFRLYNPANPNEKYTFGNVSFTIFIEGGDVKEDGVLMRL